MFESGCLVVSMLHIHNGDSTAGTAKISTIPGEHFAFREALAGGPTPLMRDGGDWRKIRARHLSESYGVDRQECELELEQQENKLASFSDHEEVVLWFEHDLFCQVNLLYLLHWFSQRQLDHTKLSLVCIDRFPGAPGFRGLGELGADQLASLFPDRKPVEQATLESARSAWQSYCSSFPTDVEQASQADTPGLPFLSAALRAHLRRFPSIRNGLGAIENLSLELVRSGANDFMKLFSRFAEAEPSYGFGDAQFALVLTRLLSAKHPALTTTGTNGNIQTPAPTLETLRSANFEITDFGLSTLRGEVDFVSLNGLDTWLGGVHLDGTGNLWRWDDQSERIVSVTTR